MSIKEIAWKILPNSTSGISRAQNLVLVSKKVITSKKSIL